MDLRKLQRAETMMMFSVFHAGMYHMNLMMFYMLKERYRQIVNNRHTTPATLAASINSFSVVATHRFDFWRNLVSSKCFIVIFISSVFYEEIECYHTYL